MPLGVDDITHSVIRYGSVVLTTLISQEYRMDSTLEEFEWQVDPRRFLRANRQVFFARASVVDFEPHTNGRLLVHLKPVISEEVIVPKPCVTELRRCIE